ncbi:MAG: alpha/beta hydrolase [Actinomycetospora chiangmaiensis]|nr:alpha/beta hydrolase [Actinomycetospora chiangmaiensis]
MGGRGVERTFLSLSDERRLAYVEAGAGPPVVLIHGSLMALEDLWLPLAPCLAGRHRVIAVDRPGHGLSVRHRLVDASPWRQARLIRDALDRLGVERPVIVGHSFGGTIALCLALAHPESVAGVVAAAPLCFPEPRLEQALFGFRAVPGAGDTLALLLSGALDPVLLPILWRMIFLPQAVPEGFARQFPWDRASGAARMIAEGEDAMSIGTALLRAIGAYGSCRVPVRILGGSADIVVNNAVHGLPASLMMPGARFDWVHGAGHMLHHFHQDRIVAEVERLAAIA